MDCGMSNKVFKQRIIPQNWSLKKVSEIAKTGSGGTPLSTCKEYYDGGNIPWINSGEVGQNSIKQTSNFITKAGMENSSAKLFPAGSVLLALYGATAGKTSFLEINATTNQAICAIMPKKGYDAKFIKYYLDALYSYLVGVSTGSARDNLNQNGIQDLEIPFPSETIQKSIAKVLSDLDAKIELNNRINRELEAMAKTLYDYWFVQFDFPNANGKPYKSSGGKMVYNAELKREIPERWEAGTLNDAISKTGTGLNPRDNFVLGEGDNYYVTIKSIEQGRVVLDDKCDKISDETLEIINKRSDLQIGDILFTSIEPVGLTYLIQEIPKNWNINESVFTIRPNYKKVTSEFLFMFLSGDYIKAYTKNVAAGSIHKGVRHSTLKECKFIIPAKNTIMDFTQLIKPILKKLDLLQKQNQHLTALRDWLLPMLMNGQVRVKEAEEKLSMAAEPSVKYKKG